MKFYQLLFLAFILASCSAPRTILHSGKVTPKGELRVGFDYSLNVPTQTVKSIADNSKEIYNLVQAASNGSPVTYNSAVSSATKTGIAYLLDPITNGYNFYGRYGLAKRLDIGYKYSGTHVYDLRYQFMGSTNTFKNDPAEQRNYGSIGLQYSSQDMDLPIINKLDTLQEILGLDFKRKDLLVPLVFSHSFGPEEKFGAISYGLVYGHSFIEYKIDPQNIYKIINSTGTTVNTTQIPSVTGKKNYSSFGAFSNIKFGYKYFYGLISFAVYYQNYGTYPLLDGETAKFKGFSFVPSAGLFIGLPTSNVFRKSSK